MWSNVYTLMNYSLQSDSLTLYKLVLISIIMKCYAAFSSSHSEFQNWNWERLLVCIWEFPHKFFYLLQVV